MCVDCLPKLCWIPSVSVVFQSPATKKAKEEKGNMKERSHDLARLKTVSGQEHRP